MSFDPLYYRDIFHIEHLLILEKGMEILKAYGNAIDAVIATG